MTLEIIPAIDMRGGQCVRLKQGDYNRETVFSDDPTQMAKQWINQGAMRLHLVDLDGARLGSPANHELVKAIREVCPVPIQFGGGLRDEESVELMLSRVCIDRAIIGTQALKQPDWFRAVAKLHPGKVALGLDARDSMVATDGWLEVSSTSAIELASQFADLKPLTIIYTNIANDGMMQGVDEGTLNDMRELCKLGFDVIASGGVSSEADIKAIAAIHAEYPNLTGAIVGRALYDGAMTLAQAHAAC